VSSAPRQDSSLALPFWNHIDYFGVVLSTIMWQKVLAARLLVQRKIGCLPVVAHGILVDIVTAMDCVCASLNLSHS
jgi:hypothetical protein